ncbi:heavy metal translocating P-type ATPase [Sansalvadorimonas verongulae]|uniref:heavy metal translocating P-type ATPase n=1 Tax=Sansalvadorimonas verongulae TaxID=2172824 RepID=UPI0012BB544B|nr:heavy metal translocating P-type ATPase [Sansalvadorimonas verongulae]MTI13944.1 cadmium-translocating P-type ATPase [Sansalvadorimonas verongulae]
MAQPASIENSTLSTTSATPNSALRRKWFIRGMDCAGCAAKVEKALNKVEGIYQTKIAFATERLFVAVESEQQIKTIEQTVKGLGFRLEATSKIQEEPLWKAHSTFVLIASVTLCTTIASLLAPDWKATALHVATAIGTLPFIRKALTQARNGTLFSIELLMVIASLGAMALGENTEAILVLLLFSAGEMLEGFAGRKARAGIQSLMKLTPDTATRIESGVRVPNVPADFLQPGDLIEVRPGDRMPVDATLQFTPGSFDESALTGESIPVSRQKGEKIMAGSLVVEQPVRLTVVSEPGENAIDRIIQLIENADERRAPITRLIDTFSSWYTPLVMAIAILVAVAPPLLFGASWDVWVYKALALLLIACPCALVISIPAAVTSALASASRFGALIKGGAALEQLRTVKQLAFDKTGTLTVGRPVVTAITSLYMEEKELLTLAASLEQGSSHPLAKAIIDAARKHNLDIPDADKVTILNGQGLTGLVNGKTVKILAPRHVQPERLAQNNVQQTIADRESEGNTVVVVTDDSKVLGLIAMADTLRDDAVETITQLKAMGISCVMLTGDNRRAAAAIAAKLGIDYKAELLPEDKVKAIEKMQEAAQKQGPEHAVAMVGDGINDAPALKAAELGIAMGRGSDVALETADAALTHERLPELATMIQLSRDTATIIRQNIALALGINTLFLFTTLFGLTGLMAAVLSDSGGALLVTINALRLMHLRKTQ